MNRFLGIVILLVWLSDICAQSTQNPFDLKYRKAAPPAAKQIVPEDTVSEITPKETFQLSPDTLSFPQSDLQVDTAMIPETIPATQPAGEETNPFETGSADSSGQALEDKVELEETEGETPVPSRARYYYASRGFQIFFLLLSILFLIFIVNVERSYIRDLWRVISNENYSSLHHRNQRNTMRQILLLMGYIIFIFQAGLFVHQTLHFYGYSDTILSSLWISMGLIIGIYLVRHGGIRYLKWLFNNEKELSLFAFDISIFNTMVGLILLPINILLIFGPETLYNPLIVIGIVVIGAAYVLRQFRWLLASRRLIFNSLFLFFIYLCAVEILPLWTISTLFW